MKDQTHGRPVRVKEDQWKNLLPHWENENVKEESENNKARRKCSVMQQTTGKLSFAEVEEELKEKLGRSPTREEMFGACYSNADGKPSNVAVDDALAKMKAFQSKLPPGSQDSIGPNDSFAKTRGKDPHGRVRMLGLGVNPSDLWGEIPSRSACHRMLLENQALMARMEERLDQNTIVITELQQKSQQQHLNNVTVPQQPISPGQSSNSINLENRLQIGGSMLLKSLFDASKTVAKGRLQSIDPNQDVGGRQLGKNWCEISISVPIEWCEELIRPYSNLLTIGDAIGTCIAWPRNLVTPDDEE